MTVTYWKFKGGDPSGYTFTRNPDRSGGDSGWQYVSKMSELDVIGSISKIQIDSFRVHRTLRFTAITGAMMRKLQEYYLSKAQLDNCTDHLSSSFSCIIINFTTMIHPGLNTIAVEDSWDLEMELVKV